MTLFVALDIIIFASFSALAVVAELVYAHDSGSCPSNWMRVRLPSTALLQNKRDKERTFKHDSIINRVNILARYLEKMGNDISWRAELGDSTKRIGDFACYIALFYGLEAR